MLKGAFSHIYIQATQPSRQPSTTGSQAKQGIEPYREFSEAIRLAESEAEAELVRMIRTAGPTDWRAAAFLLERRFQARWEKHEQVDATLTTKLDEEIERRLLPSEVHMSSISRSSVRRSRFRGVFASHGRRSSSRPSSAHPRGGGRLFRPLDGFS